LLTKYLQFVDFLYLVKRLSPLYNWRIVDVREVIAGYLYLQVHLSLVIADRQTRELLMPGLKQDVTGTIEIIFTAALSEVILCS
jgi:hypothetical protein